MSISKNKIEWLAKTYIDLSHQLNILRIKNRSNLPTEVEQSIRDADRKLLNYLSTFINTTCEIKVSPKATVKAKKMRPFQSKRTSLKDRAKSRKQHHAKFVATTYCKSPLPLKKEKGKNFKFSVFQALSEGELAQSQAQLVFNKIGQLTNSTLQSEEPNMVVTSESDRDVFEVTKALIRLGDAVASNDPLSIKSAAGDIVDATVIRGVSKNQPDAVGHSKYIYPSLPPIEPSPLTGPEGSPLELRKNREITVTGHSLNGKDISNLEETKTYLLRFRVGPWTPKNLASGNLEITDVPKEGLKTHWVVSSKDIEFVTASDTCTVQKIDSTSVAKFDLLIPECGDSETREIMVIGGGKPGNLLVTIYAVSAEGHLDLYREVSVSLAGRPEVKADETFKAPKYTHLGTIHEWTTPAEHIQISIKNSVVDISTKKFRLIDYAFTEPFHATDNKISGAIKNVRKSLEYIREEHTTYFDDLDPDNISTRCNSGFWKPYYANPNGWQPLPDSCDEAHKTAFEQVQNSAEWRKLASDGYTLFDQCFPRGTKLRDVLEELLPGSRIDFHWTEQSGAGWVSHVPWALMYMEPVGVTGKIAADPEKFLGLRFRIGTRSWNVNNGSVALGGLDKTNWMHLLYWGNKPGDETAVEAKWQTIEFKKWKQSKLLPDVASPNLKEQIVLALDTPSPSPVSVLYFYCHCSVGDGSQPNLRFGNTSKPEDTVDRTDLSQRSLPDGPIIFANACTTSQGDPHGTSTLEQSFFKRDVRAFIGTETMVPIKLASKFAWLYFQFFYRNIDASPMAAGEALTQTRMFLWTQYKNIGGLFYSMANQYDLYLASDEEVLALKR